MSNHYHHLVFGPSALARQREKGSYTAYGAQTERGDDGPDELDGREKVIIRAADQFYLSTVTETGWPYVQYRSGPAGFLPDWAAVQAAIAREGHPAGGLAAVLQRVRQELEAARRAAEAMGWTGLAAELAACQLRPDPAA